MLRLVLSALAFFALQIFFYRYLWRKIAVDTELTPPNRRRLGWLLATVALVSFSTLMGARFLSPWIGRTIGWPVFLWMACSLLLFLLFLSVDMVRISLKAARRLAPKIAPREIVDPQRRIFLNRMIGGGVAFGAVSATSVGAASALRTPKVKEVSIGLNRLTKAQDGFTVVQLTDLHAGNTIGKSFFADVVARTNSLKPDMVVITGDLVDGSVEALKEIVAPLARLQSKHGTFFVTGNHEYYAGADEWIEHIKSLGIRVLRNERVRIGGDEGFDLAGVDDFNSDQWPGHGADLAKALAGRDAERELLLLAHQPRQIKESEKMGVGLQLSGHTHGGQIWPWHYLAKAQQGGLLAGLSRHGNTQLYISRGTGHWGPPVRLFAPSEITRITLKSA